MPRKPRIHYAGALYHVILRGNARQDIFFEAQDRYRFYRFAQEGVERFEHRILAFCLMTNHIHMAIQVGEIPLSRIIQNLSFRYAKWINWRLNRSGHLFQGRYKSVLVDTETFLLELSAYLHLNPVRAGMVTNAEAYPWSSHRAYLGKGLIPWLDTEYVLGHFSPARQEASWQFAKYVDDKIGEGHQEEFHGTGSVDGRVIGEDSFIDNVLEHAGSSPVRKPDLDMVFAGVQSLYGLQEGDLSDPGQTRMQSEARGMLAWAVHELTDAKLAALAVRIRRDSSTMSAAIRRFETRRKSDPQLAKKVDQLIRKLQVSFFQA